ncbi:MAG: hypothetical protein AAF721_00020 [Myxococcota bacterium]
MNANRALVLYLLTGACVEGSGMAAATDEPMDTTASPGTEGGTLSAGDSAGDSNETAADDANTTGDTNPDTDGATEDDTDTEGGEDTCDGDCGQPGTLLWIAELDQDVETCLDVVADGEGGAVASWFAYTEDFEPSGFVGSVNSDGVERESQFLLGRHIRGLARTEPGSFAWVDYAAQAGESTTELEDLVGAPLPGATSADDVTLTDAGLAYSLSNGDCWIRMGGVDSEPLPCGDTWIRWRLAAGGDALFAGLTASFFLRHLDPRGQISAALGPPQDRTLIDIVAAPDGRVWTVGTIKDPAFPSAHSQGAFVAMHGPDLAEAPTWEWLDEGSQDDDRAWLGVVHVRNQLVLVGRDENLVPKFQALTLDGEPTWTLAHDLTSEYQFHHADIASDGVMVTCGVRFGYAPVIAAIGLR